MCAYNFWQWISAWALFTLSMSLGLHLSEVLVFSGILKPTNTISNKKETSCWKYFIFFFFPAGAKVRNAAGTPETEQTKTHTQVKHPNDEIYIIQTLREPPVSADMKSIHSYPFFLWYQLDLAGGIWHGVHPATSNCLRSALCGRRWRKLRASITLTCSFLNATWYRTRNWPYIYKYKKVWCCKKTQKSKRQDWTRLHLTLMVNIKIYLKIMKKRQKMEKINCTSMLTSLHIMEIIWKSKPFSVPELPLKGNLLLLQTKDTDNAKKWTNRMWWAVPRGHSKFLKRSNFVDSYS